MIELTVVISPPVSMPRPISGCLAVNFPGASLRPDSRFAADLKEIITEAPRPKRWAEKLTVAHPYLAAAQSGHTRSNIGTLMTTTRISMGRPSRQ
jgi:hypothetical protein